MELKTKKKSLLVGWMFCCSILLTACSISYRFNGASIDYEKTKTIQIDNFPIRSAYVWAPMQSIFTGFDQYNKGISSSGYSSQVQLKMTVNVRFVNNKKHTEDFERQFTATADYDATQQLTSVQEELVTQMTKDITDQIFNATVANW